MSESEIPQPVSAIPTRWGGFTASQLWWLGITALPPYLLLRLHLSPLLLPLLLPWYVLGLLLCFGRHEGRRLDAWLGDWLLFCFEPHRLEHPGRVAPPEGDFHSVDSPVLRRGRS